MHNTTTKQQVQLIVQLLQPKHLSQQSSQLTNSSTNQHGRFVAAHKHAGIPEDSRDLGSKMGPLNILHSASYATQNI